LQGALQEKALLKRQKGELNAWIKQKEEKEMKLSVKKQGAQVQQHLLGQFSI